MRISPSVVFSLAVFLAPASGVARAQTISAEQQPGTTAAATRPAPARFGVAGRVSTLGVGIDFAVPVMERANVRVAFNWFGLSQDFDSDDGFNLAARLQMRSLVTQFDWYPLSGGFHLSPGVMLYNGMRIDATMSAPANRTFSLGDETLINNPANPLNGNATVEFRKVAPVLALGWGNLIPRRTARRWSVPVELGLVFTQSPVATLSMNGSACRPNGTNCRDLARDA